MDTKTYVTVSGVLFLILAIAHIVRLVYGWEISVAGWSVPLWVSWLGIALTGFLAYSSFLLQKKT